MKISNLILATGNAHKTREVQEMFGSEVQVRDLASLLQVPEIIEDAPSFEGNADIKALAISQISKELVLADDSGLCVDALEGRPGVRSARFAGEQATMEENKALLLQELQGNPSRSASFVCVFTLAQHGVVLQRFRGECHGEILLQESGAGGFGYDPVFQPNGYDKTFAELPREVKNAISHRAQAMKLLQKWMNSLS